MTSDPNAPINVPQSFTYKPANLPAIPDIASLKGGELDTSYVEGPSPPLFIVKQLAPGLWYWLAHFYDGRGGYRQRGRFDEYHAATSQGWTDRRVKGQEILPLKETLDTAHAPSTVDQQAQYMSSANVFNRLIIAPYTPNGPTNYSPLFIENPTTGALTQLTYTNGSTHIVIGLSKIIINGGTYLAVQKLSQPVELLENVSTTPTSHGSMHALTAGAYGIMNTTLPDSAVLIWAFAKFYAMTYNTAYNTAPTLVNSTQFAGPGAAIGLQAVGGGDVRAYWRLSPGPNVVTPGQWYNYNTAYQGEPYQSQVFSTNQRGQDLQQLVFPMQYVPWADVYRDGILGGSPDRFVFHRGGLLRRDLRIFRDRVPNSDTLMKSAAFWIKDKSDLYAEINLIAASGSTPKTIRWREYYDFNADEWYAVSKPQQVSNDAGMISYTGGGSLPVSEQTGYMHGRQGYIGTGTPSWNRQWQPPSGTNPYQYRRSTGAASSTGQQWDSPVTSDNPALTIPGLEGKALTWHRVNFLGQMDEGSVAFDIGGTSVTDQVISQRETFTGPLNAASRWRRRYFNRNRFYELIIGTTVTQGADTYKTPQAYPYTVEGLAYDDEATFQKWSERGKVTWS